MNICMNCKHSKIATDSGIVVGCRHPDNVKAKTTNPVDGVVSYIYKQHPGEKNRGGMCEDYHARKLHVIRSALGL